MAKNYNNQNTAGSGKKPGKTWDPDAELERRRKEATERKKEAERKAKQEELDAIARENNKPEPGKTEFVKPAASQKPKQTTSKYTGSKPGPTGPSSSEKKKAREQQSSYNYVSRTSRRMNEEEQREAQLEAKRKKAEWNKSQRNNSKGYHNMINRREEAQIKKYEEAFGRKINKGWR